jgi:hypothetical protein
MAEKETENVKVSDLWIEFKHNRPLRILVFFLHHRFCYDGNRQFSRVVLYDLQRASTRYASILYGFGIYPCFYLYADGTCHQKSNR